MSAATGLVDFVTSPHWVAWRNEMRNGKMTKVPYCSATRQAEADDASTWLPHDRAVLIADAIVNGSGGGIGIELGQCGETWIAGVDFDSCRSPVSGIVEPWASAVIDRLNSYAEVSPSQSGVKQFLLLDPADVAELRRIMGKEHGRQFKRANGSDHPPSIELYISNRYFTVTWDALPDAPTDLRVAPLEDLRWLIEEAGPAFSGNAERRRSSSNGSAENDDTILGRLNTATQHNRPLAAALLHASTMRGGSRSEGALGLGAALRRAGWTYADMKVALLACPATHDWAAEADERQFERVWNRGDEPNKQEKPDSSLRPELECAQLPNLGCAKISPRRWAYGRFLLFGQCACLAAVDGGGKGAIAVGIALAMITGRPLLGEKVWRTGPVAIITYEDDQEEWHRRIAAACEHHQVDYERAIANINFIHRPRERIVFATMGDLGVLYPDGDEIITKLRECGAMLLIVDPLNHAHGLEDGNSNAMMAKVAAEMNRIANVSGVAGLVLHHLRKGSTGQVDDIMGATSIRATFRSSRVMTKMMTEEAEKLDVIDGAWRYTRISGSKENYAPPPDKATWFRLASVPLNNGTDDYPDGDEIGVATTWECRPMFEGMDFNQLKAVFDTLRTTIHGPSKQGKHTPWAGQPLVDIGKRSDREASKIVKAWIDSGVLVEEEHANVHRNKTQKVTVIEAKAQSILANISVPIYPSD